MSVHKTRREPLTDDLCWAQSLEASRSRVSRPTLFLDRDGVIVEEVPYLHKQEDVRFLDGATQLIAEANIQGWLVAVVTNQSGIGRGYYSWDAFELVNSFILKKVEDAGARIDAVMACPYHGDAKAPFNVPNHPMRKPNPGMILFAAQLLNSDLSRSIIVGDNITDIEAGKRAGLMAGYLVQTGHGRLFASKVSDLARANYRVGVLFSLGSRRFQDLVEKRL